MGMRSGTGGRGPPFIASNRARSSLLETTSPHCPPRIDHETHNWAKEPPKHSTERRTARFLHVVRTRNLRQLARALTITSVLITLHGIFDSAARRTLPEDRESVALTSSGVFPRGLLVEGVACVSKGRLDRAQSAQCIVRGTGTRLGMHLAVVNVTSCTRVVTLTFTMSLRCTAASSKSQK